MELQEENEEKDNYSTPPHSQWNCYCPDCIPRTQVQLTLGFLMTQPVRSWNKLPQQPHIKESFNCLLIRHGLSVYNHCSEAYSTLTGLPFTSEYSRHYQFDRQLIDSGLHPFGVKQCQAARQLKCLESVKVVFCSPLRRALQTASIIFSGRKVEVVVIAQLSQILSKTCDISDSVAAKKQEFKDMQLNLSLCDQFFQLGFLKSAELGGLSFEQFRERLFQSSKGIFPEKLETSSRFYKRVKVGLGKIKEACEKRGLRDGFCVITHNKVVKQLALYRGVNFKEVANCQPYPLRLLK